MNEKEDAKAPEIHTYVNAARLKNTQRHINIEKNK